jgi:RNA-directed DNA polymerase
MQMTSSQDVGAPSHEEVQWHSIDWASCHRHVRRLQTRIVKATQEGRWNKVKALQHLLTHSFAAKALAVKRVTENQGKRTPGVDGQTWSTPQAKSQAVLSLARRGYKPLPLKRVYIPKSNGKMRPLGIPTMKDRAMQALYLLALEPVAESLADRNSYGFRPQRSPADAIGQCYTVLSQKAAPPWILEGDIEGCFDNIGHDWLTAHTPLDKVVLRKWLKAGFMDKHTLYPTETGTPQGGIISPTLANLALDGLEGLLAELFGSKEKHPHRAKQNKVHYVRFADDFIITGASKELLESEVLPLVQQFMADRGLSLQMDKTRITHITEGFDFLGQNVRKHGGKLLIKPSQKSVKALLERVREIVKGNKTAKQVNLIGLLNPVIRGWANYHRHVVAKETFQTVDKEIWLILWRWASRRHPNKSRRWINRKYFHAIGSWSRVFSAETRANAPEGEPERLTLVRTSAIPIRRHIKIKGEANPYDPQMGRIL